MLAALNSSLTAERPIIFFDSHPEPPAGIVWDSLSRLKNQLYIAWTGDVVLDVKPDLIRLQWYTTEGNFGKRDYELRQANDCREAFDELCKLPEVGRVMIVGYAAQNPFTLAGSGLQESEFARRERKRQELLRDGLEYKDFVPKQKSQGSVAQRIESIIQDGEQRQKSDAKSKPLQEA